MTLTIAAISLSATYAKSMMRNLQSAVSPSPCPGPSPPHTPQSEVDRVTETRSVSAWVTAVSLRQPSWTLSTAQSSNIMTPQQQRQQQQQHTNRTLRNVTKRCSCEPLGMICEADPLMRPPRPDPSSVSGSAVPVTTLVTRAGDNTVTRVPALPESRVPPPGMKKVCSCEPGGPLCW